MDDASKTETLNEKPTDSQTIEQFTQTVTRAIAFQNEYAVTVDMSAIVAFYMARIGLPPVINLWEEIRELLQRAVEHHKAGNVTGLPTAVRLIGTGVPMWLVLKIYALVVYEFDGVYCCGEVCIKI